MTWKPNLSEILISVCPKRSVVIHGIMKEAKLRGRGTIMARGFRKRVKIAPGVHLNLSKSGVGISAGVKGLSVSTGKRGTYLNTSLPGTGLYSRTKISGGSSKSHESSGISQTSSSGALANIAFQVEDDGEIHFYSESGEEIVDPEQIKQIKHQQEYKNLLPQLKELQAARGKSLLADSETATSNFTELYKQAPIVKPQNEAVSRTKQLLDRLAPERYVKREWNIPRPARDQIRQQLENDALEKYPGLFKKKQRAAYVESSAQPAFEEAIANWENQRQLFEKQEYEIEQRENALFAEKYEEKRAALEHSLSDDEDVIIDAVEGWLSTLQLPLEMDAAIEIDGGVLYLDLDLPEVEDLPTEYVQILKSGKPSIKNKTQKQLKQEYAQCVFGLAEFLATSIFNLSCMLNHIAISGYTQRRNKNGDIDDDYIFSVVFFRDQFTNEQISDPVQIFKLFPNRMKLSTANTFSKITPFTEDEVLAVIESQTHIS